MQVKVWLPVEIRYFGLRQEQMQQKLYITSLHREMLSTLNHSSGNLLLVLWVMNDACKGKSMILHSGECEFRATLSKPRELF